jgi:hypothetical protein
LRRRVRSKERGVRSKELGAETWTATIQEKTTKERVSQEARVLSNNLS